jgi:hypothetical protein
MLRVESFNVILVAARREWKMREGEASRDVHSELPGRAVHVVNFDVILLLHPLPELL